MVGAAGALDGAAGETSARDHEGEQGLALTRSTFGISFLEVRDYAIAQLYRVTERFHRDRELFHARQVEEVCDGAEGKDQVVIRQLVVMTIETVSREHAPPLCIDSIDSAYESIHASQQLVERIDDRADLEVSRRDLVEHRGKQEEVVAGDQSYFDVVSALKQFLKAEGSVDAAKSAANNQHSL